MKKGSVKETFMITNYAKVGLICWCALGMLSNSVAQTSGTPIKNIVLVHGAWADGSGWKGVYGILVKDGYNVSIVQEPETYRRDWRSIPAQHASSPRQESPPASAATFAFEGRLRTGSFRALILIEVSRFYET